VTDARQFSRVRVDDVLCHVAFHIGEEGAEQCLLATQQQDRRGNLPERFRVSRPGPPVGHVLLEESEQRGDAACPLLIEGCLLQGGDLVVGAEARGKA
jgi:hypothetical protein